jgi:hypothetical protein
MFKDVLPILSALFAQSGPPRQPVTFSWRLVRRGKQPFFLLPEASCGASTSLELYSAQRPQARLWRRLVPWLMESPAAGLFPRVTLQVDAASDWMQFLGEQSGLPAGLLRAPAIKLGLISEARVRLVLLLCDAGDYPVRVIKVGLNPQGRASTEREADLLSRLPVGLIGCTGITGRFSNAAMSAFATAFFSGKCLTTDVGIQKLFHAWLDGGPPEPIENLAGWQELDSAALSAGVPQWPIIRNALAGQVVHPTLFHGDFTPWNVRMTNLETIRAYDWESGHLKGIPGWDWFHFVIQTSLLVKDHSPQRVAAELEQLLDSPRFQYYARKARISHVIEPLLLAYLLYRRKVLRAPGRVRAASGLFDLLWARWDQQRQAAGHTGLMQRPAAKPLAGQQIKAAVASVANLFWSPTLSPEPLPPFTAELLKHWKTLLASLAWLGVVSAVQVSLKPYWIFTPFHLLPCIFLALKVGRRPASLMAYVAAIGAPLLVFHFYPGVMTLSTTCSNIFMRIVAFKLIVILLDNIRKQDLRTAPMMAPPRSTPIQAITGNWPVIGIAAVFFVLVVVLDALTPPSLVLWPFYLLPCAILTLAMSWRWGTVTAAIAAIIGTLLQLPDPGFRPLDIELWNTGARFAVFEMVVVLLERIRRGYILFWSSTRKAE